LGARIEFGVGHLFWVVRGFVTVADSGRWARARLSYIRYRNWLGRSLWARLALIRYHTRFRRSPRARLALIRYRTLLRQSLRARLLVFMTYLTRRHTIPQKNATLPEWTVPFSYFLNTPFNTNATFAGRSAKRRMK
jgi:hypothetical protein